jgi:periplasmic protein TonB
MFQQPKEKSGTSWWVGWSVILHATLLVLLFRSNHAVRVRTFLPGTPKGTHIDLTYLPGGAPPSAPQSVRKQLPPAPKESRLTLPPQLTPPVSAPVANTSTTSPATAAASSNDALGSDDIQIAFTTYSPSPRPDLSRLPRGAQGEVILDVTIDPTGQVADLQILATLGYGVDGSVVDTVRTWKFTPATKDGVPVASVQELHFHYGPV